MTDRRLGIISDLDGSVYGPCDCPAGDGPAYEMLAAALNPPAPELHTSADDEHSAAENVSQRPAPGSAQEPADPPEPSADEALIEDGARAMYDAVYRSDPASPYREWEWYAGTPLQRLIREGVAAALPILRAGIEAEVREKIAQQIDGVHSHMLSVPAAARIVRGKS